MKSPYSDRLDALTTDQLISLASAIQQEMQARAKPKKSIYAELERLAKSAGISIKELEFLT